MMNRNRSKRIRESIWTKCFAALLLSLFLSAALAAPAQAQQRRQGDRLGIRFGVWPQPGFDARLGSGADVSILTGRPEDEFRDTAIINVDMRIIEPAGVAPYVELFGEFHLKGIWWIEGSVGYAVRTSVELAGLADTIGFLQRSDADRILLASGRVDFFPLFGGLRMKHDIGPPMRPHNIYARAGLSLIVASETASKGLHPDIQRLYNPGSEGAPGFLLGGGGEFFLSEKWAATLDVNYRYGKLTYGPQANFNVSSIWVALGLVVRTR